MICCETTGGSDLPEGFGLIAEKIPAGKYAKFDLKGDPESEVVAFWTKLHAVGLDRKFQADFEEYQPCDEN